MAFIIKTVKTVRSHWKKSTFAAVVLTYGFNYTKNYFETQDLMRVYCQKAAKYGHEPIPVHVTPRSITVVLNPNANKRKATEDFEKYCAPLLHLAGICVEVVKTENEGHAKQLMQDMSSTDAIVIAGGDGTLSEVVTGLLRRTGESTQGLVPIGILPLGKNNSVAKNFFPSGGKLEKVKSLADATMAVVEEVVKPIDVMKIEVVGSESKPVYAVGGLKWGAYRDAEVKKDSYWYFGSLRKYATYLFNGYKNSLTWHCEAVVNYSPPCDGCSNCINLQKNDQPQKWFQKFIKEENPRAKYLKIKNPECEEIHEKKISTTDLSLLTSNAIPSSLNHDARSKLQLNIGPNQIDYIDFVRQGWQSENGESRRVEEIIEARTIEIKPERVSKDDSEVWFSIDNENFEVKPIKITLLPKIINMFCKKDETL